MSMLDKLVSSSKSSSNERYEKGAPSKRPAEKTPSTHAEADVLVLSSPAMKYAKKKDVEQIESLRGGLRTESQQPTVAELQSLADAAMRNASARRVDLENARKNKTFLQAAAGKLFRHRTTQEKLASQGLEEANERARQATARLHQAVDADYRKVLDREK